MVVVQLNSSSPLNPVVVDIGEGYAHTLSKYLQLSWVANNIHKSN